MANIAENTESERSFTLYYTDESNNDIAVKTLKKVKKMKDFTEKFMSDKKHLEDIKATQVFVLDNDDNEIYVIVKNEDDSWEELLENFEFGVEDEIKNVLINKVFYSLTHLFPDNFKLRAPELYSSVISNKSGFYTDPYEDMCGWLFDKGDAKIRMTLSGNLREEKREWVNKVAAHYNLDLKRFGENAYEIIIPDQERYFLVS